MDTVAITALDGVVEGLTAQWEGEGAKELQEKVRLVKVMTSWRDEEVSEEDIQAVSHAAVLVGDPPLLASCLRSLCSRGVGLPLLQWIHCTWAGPDALIKAMGELEAELQWSARPLVTRSVGHRMRADMAAFVVGRIIEQERMFAHSRRQQEQATWDQLGVRAYRSLRDITVAIMGVGTIGTAVANSAAFLGMTVIGLNSRGVPPALEEGDGPCAGPKAAMDSRQWLHSAVDAWYPVSSLEQVLPQCDFLVNLLPSSHATRGLLNGDAFKPAAGRTTFINIGRGDIVDENALLRALDERWLAGAILDVHYQEPLPFSSRLWAHENVTISPHVGSVSSGKDIVAAFRKELGLLLSQETADKPVTF